MVRSTTRATRPAPLGETAPARDHARLIPNIIVTLACAGISMTAAWTTKTVVAATGACASLAIVGSAVRSRSEASLLAGQLPVVAVAVTTLAATNAGLARSGGAAASWRPLLAALAFPFLGRAVLRVVERYRRVREADVMVEGALVGAAAGIVLQVVLNDWRPHDVPSFWGDAGVALPVVLMGLDVALLVVGVRGLTTRAGRRSPLALIYVSVVCLATAHVLQAISAAQGGVPGPSGHVAAAIGLAFLGATALHPGARTDPDVLTEEVPLFSPGHAVIVVVALLSTPAVLAIQALRNVTASTTVATGAVLSGVVLACYLVALLQERAATEHQATHDPLTGLPNRVLFTDRLERALAHARRNDQPVGVLFIDVDRFKDVNDTFGHAAGDWLLRTLAGRLLSCRREEDTLARLSGDEFAVLLPHLAKPADVMVVVQRVLDALSEPATIAGERMLVTASIGVAVYPNDGDSAAGILSSADAAMYLAKETSGTSFEIFSASLATQAHERIRLESALYVGMHRDELALRYQPIVDIPSGRTVGAEALVRWMHPEKGLVLPGQFIPVAEQSDLIIMLGERVILGACEQLRRWADLGLGDLSVSVNASSRHFSRGLVSSVTSALRETGASPTNLVIELTESTAVDNLEVVVAALEELRGLGVRSAIDDFGTGYCGLRYLSTLPVDCLKIDRAFIQGMTPSDAAIVGATIAMGHSLGLTLVAEGVETHEQRRFLLAQGCDLAQGYLLGHPMSAEELTDRVRSERAEAEIEPNLSRLVEISPNIAIENAPALRFGVREERAGVLPRDRHVANVKG